MRVSRKISQVSSSALPLDFLERLVDGDGADGDGRIADDPLAGGVDVFAGGEVHDGVGAPLGGPAHFFDFFLDAGGDGAVADVGVDFDEEIAADDHRLELGVVDVGGDDGAAAGDFGADELGRDFVRDALRRSDSPGCWCARERLQAEAGVLLVESRRGAMSCVPPSAILLARPRFSRMAMNSISGVMMPWRAYQSCVTGWPALARSGLRFGAAEMLEAIPALGGAGELFVAAREVAVVLAASLRGRRTRRRPLASRSTRRGSARGLALNRAICSGSPHGPLQS